MPIQQSIFEDNEGRHFEYHWRLKDQLNYLKCCCSTTAELPEPGSLAAFIHSHDTAYTKDKDRTYSFTIDHPEWKIYPGLSYALQLAAGKLYGEAFSEAFTCTPLSIFVLDGSKTNVSSPRLL